MSFIFTYLSVATSFVAIDMIWLKTMADRLYRPVLGEILRPEPNLTAAAFFYLVYPLGLIAFAVLPAHCDGSAMRAFTSGMMFGCFTYATYDLTNPGDAAELVDDPDHRGHLLGHVAGGRQRLDRLPRGATDGILAMIKAARAAPESAAAFRRGRWSRFAAFILLVPGIGLVIGALNLPGAWYAALNKPPFNPPNWVFAPVWTALFLMIAVAGFRTFEREPRGTAMKLWAMQMALNLSWSPIFFSLHRIDVALAVIIALLAAIVAFVGRQWRNDQAAALLFIPYAAWAGFATILNVGLLLLN